MRARLLTLDGFLVDSAVVFLPYLNSQNGFEDLWTALAAQETVDPDGVAIGEMVLKDIDLMDRTELRIPIQPSRASGATHVVLMSDKWFPRIAIYRVTDVLTRTLTAQSTRLAVQLDPLATLTVQTSTDRAMDVSGWWDIFDRNLGESSKPYAQPMVIDRTRSVSLPSLPRLINNDIEFDIVFVKVTGVTQSGEFKTYGTFCYADPTNRYVVYYYGTGPSEGNIWHFPRLAHIINDPQTYTPFNTSDSIIDISVSARAPFEVLRRPDFPTDLIFSGQTLVKVGPEGDVYMVMVELTDASFGSAYIQDVPSTGSVPWMYWPQVEMDLRDMMGNVVANIDTKWSEGVNPSEYTYDKGQSDPTTVSGLRIGTSVTFTNIITSLIFPDGSHIEWPEGHLPYNTDVYKDYLATQQRYDRDMLDISLQQSRGQTIINSTSSLINGVLAGALSGSGPLGILSAGVGVIGNIAAYDINRKASEAELVAKQQQLQLMPDKTFTGAATDYLDGVIYKGKGSAVDMITIKLPSDMTVNGVWAEGYRQQRFKGFYAGGRYAHYLQKPGGVIGQYLTRSHIRLKGLEAISSLLVNKDQSTANELVDAPVWLKQRAIDRLMIGTDVIRVII